MAVREESEKAWLGESLLGKTQGEARSHLSGGTCQAEGTASAGVLSWELTGVFEELPRVQWLEETEEGERCKVR